MCTAIPSLLRCLLYGLIKCDSPACLADSTSAHRHFLWIVLYYFGMVLPFCLCLFSTSKVIAALCTWWFSFLRLIDNKDQPLWVHNAACPQVDCKFLLGLCGCIDLKISLYCLSSFSSSAFVCVHFPAVLLPHPLRCCLMMALQSPSASQNLYDFSWLQHHIEMVCLQLQLCWMVVIQ